MIRWRRTIAKILNLFRNERAEDELAREIAIHLALLEEEFQGKGMTPGDARLAARQAYGGLEQAKQLHRKERSFIWLEEMWQDLRYAFRRLRNSPGFTAVALLTLALGVGANTTVFSMINGLLLRPLPAPHAEQLAVLRMEEGGAQPDYAFCTPFFRSLENRHEVFENVFAYNGDELQVRGPSGNETIHGMVVSGQFFSGLQTAPLMGRYLTPEDDRRGGSPTGFAVVISEHFWESWFHRAPDVVGRKLVIANVPFTVAGVMPKQFTGPDPTQRPEIYAPLSADPIIDAPRNHIDAGTHAWWITVMARLKPGVSLEQANAALLTVSSPILHDGAADDPGYVTYEEKAHFHFAAESGSRGFTFARSLFRKPLVAMFAMCVGILVLACLNLASLMMARGATRERELATRLAMGATRNRLVRQLLVESLLIAVLGTAAGLAMAPLVSHSLSTMLTSSNANVQLDTSLDAHVFGFAALIAAISALLIGLVPALQATAGNLSDHIKEGQHAMQAHERRRLLPQMLLSFEVALAMVLVVAAGLLATSLVRLYKSGAGFNPHGLMTIAFRMDKQPLEGDALMRIYRELGDGLSHQPGVKNASFEFIVPLSQRGWNGNYSAPGGNPSLINMNSVGPNYFETMRIPIALGREFRWSDTKASGLKLILNETAAKTLFPGRDALGQQVRNDDEKTSYEVVAVVGDTKYRDMRSPAPPIGYVPILQDEQPKPSLTAVVRTNGPEAPLAAAARSLAARVAPTIPSPIVTTMDDVMNESMMAERLMALLSLFFAGCALLVTAIGLYGTLACATARRTSEIGIRMAMGAQRRQVGAMVFRENAATAAIGSVVGLIAAIVALRALASFLYRTSTLDPWVLAGSLAAITVIASAASLLPALRAAWIEPMAAIRCE